MSRGPANGDALRVLQKTVLELRRRPLTIAYAVLLVDHLAFDIGREGKYPPRPELHQRLEGIEARAAPSRASNGNAGIGRSADIRAARQW